MALKTRGPQASRAPQLVPVEDLTGGVDLRRSPTLLGPTRARTLLNQSLEEPGALVMRPGYLAASSVTFGANPQGGQRVYLSSRTFTLMALDGAIYKPSDAWVKGAAVGSSVSSGTQVFFPFDRDIVAVFDGTARPRMSTDGSTWVLMGIDAGSSKATLSSLSTGGLSSGEFEIAYTYKHRGTAHESNYAPVSTLTITASSGAITATASPSTDAKVDAIVWYARHKSDGESVLRKVSSGSSLTVVITSSNWTTNDEAPLNHMAPVAGVRFATLWKNRWWAPDGTVLNRLRFTELFQPQSWPSDFFIDIPFEKGDNIAAQRAHGDTLEIYGQNTIFLVIGQTALDFEVRPSAGAQGGAFGPRAVAQIEDATFHANAQDFQSFDGTDRSLGFDINPAIRDLVTNATSSGLANVATVYDPLRTEVRVSVPRVYPTAARGEWVLNLNRTRENQGAPAWTTTDRDIAFYMHWSGNEATAGNRGRLFTINSTGGFIFEENVGASANSSNMTATYEGPSLSFGMHRSRIAGTHFEVEPHGGAFSAELVTDGVSQGVITIPIGTGLYAYGTATYGTATYAGAGRLKPFTPQPLAADGQTATLKTVYTGTERFRLFNYAHVIVPEGAPRQVN